MVVDSNSYWVGNSPKIGDVEGRVSSCFESGSTNTADSPKPLLFDSLLNFSNSGPALEFESETFASELAVQPFPSL